MTVDPGAHLRQLHCIKLPGVSLSLYFNGQRILSTPTTDIGWSIVSQKIIDIEDRYHLTCLYNGFGAGWKAEMIREKPVVQARKKKESCSRCAGNRVLIVNGQNMNCPLCNSVMKNKTPEEKMEEFSQILGRLNE